MVDQREANVSDEWRRQTERERERGENPVERERGRSAAIGIINDRNRTKMRTGRVRRRR